jgi:hypothetical protein
LLLLDPFETSIHKDNCEHGQTVEDKLESEIRLRISSSNQPSNGSRLAEMLAENDPFEIVDAMKNVGAIYESSNCYSEENVGLQCVKGDCCSGCSICDGMEYMENIRNYASMDDVDEDEAFCPNVEEVFCVDTDDENLDFATENADDQVYSDEYESKSFWDHRAQLALVLQAEKKQKELHNSSCRYCFAPTHCSQCNSKDFPSAKKSATYIKEFAMRTQLMELGVRN